LPSVAGLKAVDAQVLETAQLAAKARHEDRTGSNRRPDPVPVARKVIAQAEERPDMFQAALLFAKGLRIGKSAGPT
jgi:hypothetical protein